MIIQRQQTVQSCICNVPHGVFDGPDDTVHEELELRWWYGKKC